SRVSTEVVKTALMELRKHDGVLQLARRDWRKVADDFGNVVRSFEDEVRQLDLESRVVDGLREIETFLGPARALAAAGGAFPYADHEDATRVAADGYNAWLASLPDDDWSDAADPEQERSLRWTTAGWVESA